MSIVVSDVINDVAVWAGVAGTIFGFAKSKWFRGAIGFIEKEAPVISKEVGAVLDTPLAKAEEAKLSAEFKKLALSNSAQAVIKGIETATKGAKKLYDDLSSSQKAAAIKWVQDHLPVSVNATEKEIVSALQNAPSLSREFANDSTFAKATELTQLLAKANAPEPKPESQAQPAPTKEEAATNAGTEQ